MPSRFPITVSLIVLTVVILAKTFVWSEKSENGQLELITSDGIGYYTYLSSTLFEKNFSNQEADGRYFVETNSGVVIKYYPGSAILMAPFTGIVYIFSPNGREDAFAKPYQLAIAIAALFYFAIGLFWLQRLLELYQVSVWANAITLVSLVFGTHLLNYVLAEPAMSHVYSWFAVTGFVYFTRKYTATEPSRKNLLIASALFGLVVLIRPVNGLVIFAVPFLSGSLNKFLQTLKYVSKSSHLIPAGIICLAIIGIHPAMVYIQSGSINLWTYSNEGFYFTNPAFLDFLFSWRKGLFLYTPMALLCVFSALTWRKNTFLFLSFTSFLALVFYILSSWWNWYYGPSFSQRPFVEFLGIAAIPLGIVFSEKWKPKYLLLSLLALAGIISLNLIQTYQYNRSILSKWDMTKEKYKYVFLKTSSTYEDVLGGNNDIRPYEAEMTEIYSALCTMDDTASTYIAEHRSPIKVDSNNLAADYTGREFNLLVDITADSGFKSSRGLFAEMSLERLEIDKSACTFSYLVIHFMDKNGNGYSYHPIKINLYPNDAPGQIQEWNYNIELPSVRDEKDRIRVYVWNPKKLAFKIDNLRLDLYRVD